MDNDFARQLIDRAAAEGVACYETTADILASIAEKENPQGVIAVARQQRVKLDDLTPQNFPWGVAIVSPQDPGNVGTILRTIDAVGASGLILLDSGVDPYHPTAVRASLGSIFWYPIVSASFTRVVTVGAAAGVSYLWHFGQGECGLQSSRSVRTTVDRPAGQRA